MSSLLYIRKPIVNMKEEPKDNCKVVSQVIFSEKINLSHQEGDWSLIVSSDGYTGWIPSNSYISLDQPYDATLKISRLAAHIYGLKDIEYGPILTLPYGSKLRALERTADGRWIIIALPDGREGYIQKGDVVLEEEVTEKEHLVRFSQQFLGLPYTWGGRSSFGYDCSGFIQMLYNQIHIQLQRDSKQQVLDERFQSISMEDLEPGDLIFFGQSEKVIRHVGMFTGNGHFIHATARECKPWLRISHLSDFEWSGHSDAGYPYRLARQLYRPKQDR